MTYPHNENDNAPAIGAGTYLAEILSTAVREVGKDNSPCVSIKFRVPACGGATIYGDVWLTDRAFERSAETLAAIGFDLVAEGFAIEKLNGEGSPLVGREAEIVVEWQPPENGYPGRFRVKWINAPGGGVARDAMNEDKAKSLGAHLRARFGGAGGAKPAAAPPPSADDVPF